MAYASDPNAALVPAIHLSRNLSMARYTGDIPGPRKVYDLVLRGVIPAENVNGRWYYRSARLAEIAALLGLTPPAPVPAPRPRKAAAEQQKVAA
jgi:hypothetical protein